MKVREYRECGTYGVRSLDLQLISQLNQIHPNALVEFSDLNITCGSGVHPYLQPAAKTGLKKAITERGVKMICNSAYRTLAQQQVIYSHYKNGRCGIVAAAKPGYSNHNSGLAIDIEDAPGWRPYLERNGWKWIGAFDPMHFDFKGAGIDLRNLSIKAFQMLWNANNLEKLVVDGVWGAATERALLNSPVEGYTKPQNIEIAASNKQKEWENLRFGDSGDRVNQLQSALTKHGFTVFVDGEFGQDTQSKVSKFQAKAGLAADGIVGTMTANELGLI